MVFLFLKYHYNSQVMIIMAWHGLETPLELLDPLVFGDILSIFVTNAVLRLIQGCSPNILHYF